MRKQLLTISFILLSTILATAQGVSVNTDGTAADASAMLDVKSTTTGLLIPRVYITDLATEAPVTTPATSLMVYNTNTTTGPGFFYYDGTAWVNATGAKAIDDLTDGKTTVGNSLYLGSTASSNHCHE